MVEAMVHLVSWQITGCASAAIEWRVAGTGNLLETGTTECVILNTS